MLLSFSSLNPTTAGGRFKEISASEAETARYKEWHQVIDAGDGSILITNHFGSCSIVPPVHPPRSLKLNPILAASFPGSPTDSVRFILEGITGIWTSARTFREDVVAIKTHYPYYDQHIGVNSIKKGQPRAIFFLRDPLDTMETWQRWYYNAERKIEQHVQTPIEDWIRFRDKRMDYEIKQWKKHLEYWLDNLPAQSRLIIVHENLIDDALGPTEAQKLARFVSKNEDIPMVQNWEEVVPCIWQHVIKFQQVHQYGKLQNNYEQNYSFQQLDSLASLLTGIIDKYESEKSVTPVIIRYRNNVLQRMENIDWDKPIMVKNPRGTCIVTKPQYKEDLIPIFQASYPASGSELTEHLMEALTGVKTSEFKRKDDVISVKTYYPTNTYHISKGGRYNRDMDRALILLRNPIHAISSNFNHLYEKSNKLEQHSGTVPLKEWISWRDNNFLTELNRWNNHIEYWMDNFQYPDKLIITYEALIDNKRGASESKRIVQFLNLNGEKENIPTAPLSTVPCLWYRVYNYYKTDDPYTSTHSYHNELTSFQLETIATSLNNLKMKYKADSILGFILDEYWEDVISRMQ